MNKSFLYGLGVGTIFVLSFPVYFSPYIIMCGPQSNSWLHLIPRVFGSPAIPLTFILVIGLIFGFFHFISFKDRKNNLNNSSESRVEKIFKKVVLTTLTVLISASIYAIFIHDHTGCDSMTPPAPSPLRNTTN